MEAYEIVRALRLCADKQESFEECHSGQCDCPFGKTVIDCTERMNRAAADMIESLQTQRDAALEDLYYIHCAGQKGCEICQNRDQCGESDSHIGDCTGFEWRGPKPPKEDDLPMPAKCEEEK